MSKKTSELGLPIEYEKLPEFFDDHNVNADTDSVNALIEKLLREQGVQSVLDMTCGTGSQVFYLVQRDYDVVGSDLSQPLINQANAKAKKMGLDVALNVGDMRTIQLGKFDAVITIFNAIGHLSKADFEIALQNIRRHLNDDGIYIFDIFNREVLTDDLVDTFVMDIECQANGIKFRNQQHSELDHERGLLISHDKYTIIKNNDEPEVYTNTFSLQVYTVRELQDLLVKNGFEVLAHYDMKGRPFVADKSLNILTVAKAK